MKKKCKACKGEGGKDVAVPCSLGDTMWVDDGECMELGHERCSACNGTGFVEKKK